MLNDSANETNSLDSGESLPPIDTATASSLVGTLPAEALALPDFTATNSDGQPRSQVDLTGKPTVIWFYPAAGTYG